MGAATALDMVADRVIGGYPVCVKPAHGGSALGIHKVESQEELGEAVLDALSYDEAVNIEQWVDGVELSVSILGTGWDAHALPPVEIVAREGFYDATARMADDAVEFFCPVRDESLSPNAADAQAIRAEIERAALEVYRAADIPRRFIPGTIIFGCCLCGSHSFYRLIHILVKRVSAVG